MRRLLKVVARLRGPKGCPWDRKQTLRSLRPGLLEETYELLEALDRRDPRRHAEELGDLLLQIVLHAQIRAEQGRFTFDQVARRVAEKLVRRHPHVFGRARVKGVRGVLQQWERLKAGEGRGRTSVLDGLPPTLPALLRAQRVQIRAGRVGFDWKCLREVEAKVQEELAEWRRARRRRPSRAAEELGDLLFAVVNLCRWSGVSAEDALRQATAKFERRFREVERRLQAAGRSPATCTARELDALWTSVKGREVLRRYEAAPPRRRVAGRAAPSS